MASRLLRQNSLSIVFLLLFLAALVGQAFAGWHQFNAQQVSEQLGTISFGDYLTSASFAVDVAENWQSEYLQFLLYIVGTIWLIQIGSPESPSAPGLGTEEDHKIGEYAEPDSPKWAKVGGFRTLLFSWSLSLTMLAIFLASWTIQSVAGWAAFNETQLQSRMDTISWGSYLVNADFWARTLQNWQSEFLAVGSMAILAVYLRQRGSAESKPVGEPHDSTGATDGE
ncbi:hypothetical protein H1W00_13860 [Aeromicrobium sp. Marseille-Q0843]|uniref:Transmembrane protein n=1 Tax=Aeromicrobium phoceense TaxID=2754045 RepID=A0A838XI72_9ACTN|nr:DUF6766 family protein [Aeromicrobium phoceense]MBA4609567.1 hypothetical protein [Aeromicrobium phoceense]